MLRRKSAARVAQDKFEAAQMAVKDFWGRSSGSDGAFDQLENVLSGHGLTAAQIDRLRMKLPPITRGTVTGNKVLRADSLLKRLHTAAGG